MRSFRALLIGATIIATIATIATDALAHGDAWADTQASLNIADPGRGYLTIKANYDTCAEDGTGRCASHTYITVGAALFKANGTQAHPTVSNVCSDPIYGLCYRVAIQATSYACVIGNKNYVVAFGFVSVSGHDPLYRSTTTATKTCG